MRLAEQSIALRATKGVHKADMSIYTLSGNHKIIYNEIFNAMTQQQTKAKLPKASSAEILSVYNKVISENINGFLYKPGRIRLTTWLDCMELNMELCEGAENRIAYSSRIDFEVSEIMCTARKAVSDYEKILNVYRYFIEHFKYTQLNQNDEKFHTMVSPFIYRQSVCEGFAFAFSYIMNRLGFPCGIVSGQSTLANLEGSHAWNIIKLGNDYFHLDITWDICIKKEDYPFFDYFMLDDSLMRKDHEWNDKSLPLCTNSSMEFYSRRGLICRNRNEIVMCLSKQLKSQNQYVAFRFLSNHPSALNDDEIIRCFDEAINMVGKSYRSVQYENGSSGTTHFCVNY